MQNQSSSNQNGVSTIISDEEIEKLNNEAEQLVKNLNGEETVSVDKTLDSLSKIGEREQNEAGNTLEILKRPVRTMMEGKNNDIPKTLLELRHQVENLNPDQKGIKGIFGKISRKSPLKNYVRKYESSQSQIDAIVSALYRGRDQLKEDVVELKIIKKESQEKVYNLEKQLYLSNKVLERLEEEANKEAWADKLDVINKSRAKLSVRANNMATMINVLIQSVASIDKIIDTNEALEESVFNAVTLTKNVGTVSVAIQLSLQNQQNVINSIDAVNKTTQDMITSNAKLLKENTARTAKQLEEPAIQLNALRQAFNDVQEAIRISEESNNRIINNSKSFMSEITKLNAEMKDKLQK